MFCMSVASAWHNLTSLSLWADVIAVLTLIVTIAFGWQAFARRRLTCTVVSRSRLMNAPQAIRDNLKISYEGRTFDDPYVTVFEIGSTGRAAIPSTSFDNGRNLQLDLVATIETILSVEVEPQSATKPSIVNNGSVLELKPELIARREVIRIALLTE